MGFPTDKSSLFNIYPPLGDNPLPVAVINPDPLPPMNYFAFDQFEDNGYNGINVFFKCLFSPTYEFDLVEGVRLYRRNLGGDGNWRIVGFISVSQIDVTASVDFYIKDYNITITDTYEYQLAVVPTAVAEYKESTDNLVIALEVNVDDILNGQIQEVAPESVNSFVYLKDTKSIINSNPDVQLRSSSYDTTGLPLTGPLHAFDGNYETIFRFRGGVELDVINTGVWPSTWVNSFNLYIITDDPMGLNIFIDFYAVRYTTLIDSADIATVDRFTVYSGTLLPNSSEEYPASGDIPTFNQTFKSLDNRFKIKNVPFYFDSIPSYKRRENLEGIKLVQSTSLSNIVAKLRVVPGTSGSDYVTYIQDFEILKV